MENGYLQYFLLKINRTEESGIRRHSGVAVTLVTEVDMTELLTLSLFTQFLCPLTLTKVCLIDL